MKLLRWLAVLSVLAVFIAPPTRRAAFEQARLVLGLTPPQAYLMQTSALHPNPAWLERRQKADYQRVADRHPDDIGLQMAIASNLPFSITEFNKAVVAGLRPLAASHPNSPAVYAQLLQHGAACLGEVGDEYRAVKPEFQPFRDAIDPKPAHPSPRVSYADYLSWASAGQQLDPDNAFFPAMRSVCLFKMGRKSDALESLRQAGSKPRWEDYSSETARGADALPREAYGRTDPMASAAVYAMMFPVYAMMRELSKSAVEEAKVLERAGKTEAGLNIRRDLWRMARVWRAQRRDLIGTMVAMAVGKIALGELGGKVTVNPKWPGEKKNQVRLDAALAYLQRTGHGADADWLRADMAKSDAMHDIISQGLERGDTVGTMMKAMGSWATSVALLNAALWLALLAFLANWANREAAGKGRRTLTAIAFTMLLFAWQGYSLLGSLASSGPDGFGLFAFGWASAAVAALAVPLTLATIFDITALVRRKPFFETSSAWLRASLVPAACVVALLFVGVSVWGVKPQRAFQEYSAAQVTGEGPYYARLMGREWPK